MAIGQFKRKLYEAASLQLLHTNPTNKTMTETVYQVVRIMITEQPRLRHVATKIFPHNR